MPNNGDADTLWRQLGHGTQRVTGEDRIIWAIFGIFFAANAILLRVVFGAGKDHVTLRNIAVPLFGIVMSTLWFFIQGRALAHLKAWEKIVERLEKELKIRSDITFSSSLNQKYRESLGCWPRTRSLMYLGPVVLALLWATILIFLLLP